MLSGLSGQNSQRNNLCSSQRQDAMKPVKSKVLYDLRYVFSLHNAVNSHTQKQVYDYIEEPITQRVDRRHVLSTIWVTVKNKNRMR